MIFSKGTICEEKKSVLGQKVFNFLSLQFHLVYFLICFPSAHLRRLNIFSEGRKQNCWSFLFFCFVILLFVFLFWLVFCFVF